MHPTSWGLPVDQVSVKGLVEGGQLCWEKGTHGYEQLH